MNSKSLFASKTVWSAVVTFWFALAPTLDAVASQNRYPTPREWVAIVGILITTAATIYSRYAADSTIHTPKGLPGRDKPELVNEQADPDASTPNS